MITSGFTAITSEYSIRLSRRLYLDIPILWLCNFSPGGGCIVYLRISLLERLMKKHIYWLLKETFREILMRLGGLDRSSTGQVPLCSMDPRPMDLSGSMDRSERLNSWWHFFWARFKNPFTRWREAGVIKYSSSSFIFFTVYELLWNKTRAINIQCLHSQS